MKKYVNMLVGLFASLMLSTAVFAGSQTGASFGTLDADQDGSLSPVEASADPELSSQWSDIDKDENGVIDQAEFSAFEGTGEYGASEKPMEEK